MPEGWVKYAPQDDREINTLRGNLTNVENKLLTIKNAENPVNSNSQQERILKIEVVLKNMFVSGNNAFSDLYSKFDSIGDFTLKNKLKNPVKEEEKKQNKPIYLEPEQQETIFKKVGRPKSKIQKTPEEQKKDRADYMKQYRKKKSTQLNLNTEPEMNQENTDFIDESSIVFNESNTQNNSSGIDLISKSPYQKRKL